MAPQLLDAPRQVDATPKELRLVNSKHGSPVLFGFVAEYLEDERTTPDFEPNELHPSFDLSGYVRTMQQINDLAAGEESDEYGVLRPTKHARRITRKVLRVALEDALCRKPSLFPRGAVTTDENGGLRIEWSDGDTAVCLVIPAQKGGQSYIYHEHGNAYGTTGRVTGSLLSSRLQKFLAK